LLADRELVRIIPNDNGLQSLSYQADSSSRLRLTSFIVQLASEHSTIEYQLEPLSGQALGKCAINLRGMILFRNHRHKSADSIRPPAFRDNPRPARIAAI